MIHNMITVIAYEVVIVTSTTMAPLPMRQQVEDYIVSLQDRTVEAPSSPIQT